MCRHVKKINQSYFVKLKKKYLHADNSQCPEVEFLPGLQMAWGNFSDIEKGALRYKWFGITGVET